ncbi:MAG: hypothetical protein HYW57_04205 [Ignavibacteriales bacterium]|nr:hypothetical protein [Ignavibacteriales bacterium]
MNEERIAKLKRLLDQDPGDSFTRYALGLEFAGKDETRLAISFFQEVIRRDPTYVPAYQQLGYAFQKLERRNDAVEVLRRGIEVATKLNDMHARNEMEEALNELEP